MLQARRVDLQLFWRISYAVEGEGQKLTILTSLRFFEVSSTKLDIQIKEDEMQKEKYDLI